MRSRTLKMRIAVHCLRSLFDSCRTLPIFLIVASSFESVLSSSLPNSSSILKKEDNSIVRHLKIRQGLGVWLQRDFVFMHTTMALKIYPPTCATYTACSSTSIPICLLTVFSVPMESLRTSSCKINLLSMRSVSWRDQVPVHLVIEAFAAEWTRFLRGKRCRRWSGRDGWDCRADSQVCCTWFRCVLPLPLCSLDCYQLRCSCCCWLIRFWAMGLRLKVAGLQLCLCRDFSMCWSCLS